MKHALLASMLWGNVGAMDLMDALAAIETGATSAVRCTADFKVGRNGEVSRYQILPVVWESNGGGGRDYTDPSASRRVARVILVARKNDFVRKHKRWPTLIETYALWNAPAQAMRGKISKVVMERAKRFENLDAAYQTTR